jgi:hypothetical protein
VCVCVRACVVLDPCVLAAQNNSAATRIAKLNPKEQVAAMKVFTTASTRTAENHDIRSPEARSKDDKETSNERIELFVQANPNQRPTQANVRKWLKSLEPTKTEGKVKGLALARLRRP